MVIVREREVARGTVETVLAMCLGVEPRRGAAAPAWMESARVDRRSGTVHVDSLVPDADEIDEPELAWLGI